MTRSREPLAALPRRERPRERLGRLGPEALSDAELLALVMGSGQPGLNVLESARAVLFEAGGFRGLISMDTARLQRLPGVRPATAGRLVAAAEMWRRAAVPESTVRLTDSAAIARVVLPELMHRRTERFLVVVADRALRLIEVVLLREGSENRTRVETSEVLQSVLSRRGSAFVVAHNHPGGSLEASRADVEITAQLHAAADTVGVRFLDHVVVAGGDWRSIA